MRLGGLLLLIGALLLGSAQAAEPPVVIATVDRTPLAYTENGKLTGLFYDLTVEAFRRMGRPLDFRLLPWPRCVAELRAGNIDGTLTMFRTQEREAAFTFTDETVLHQTVSLFVKKDSPLSFGGDLSMLSGKRVGVIYQTSYGQRLDNALNGGVAGAIETERSMADLVKMLAHGRIDVLPGDRGRILGAAEVAGLSDQIRELQPAVDVIPGFAAFTKIRDLTGIAKSFDQALRAMKADGTYAAILRKYPNP
jgi:polar amino acid transport system substrate-binding protein